MEARQLFAGDVTAVGAAPQATFSDDLGFCPAPYLVHSFHIDSIHSIDGGASLNAPTNVPTLDGSSSEKTSLSLPILQSHPSARQKIFLDFDGHVVHATGWNDLNGGRPIHAPGFDLDGDSATYSEAEIAVVERVWAQVAEDFAPFDIDVTTESPSLRSLRAGSESIRVLISSNIDQATGNRWLSPGNGVAYVNSWQFQSDTPAWVFANKLGGNAKYIAESVSHEVGHALGLHHDGVVDGVEYYQGHGSGEHGWAPIMGLGYHQTVTQWSHGEYSEAENDEDDIQIILSEANQVRLRVDDHGDEFSDATLLTSTSNHRLEHDVILQDGIISTRQDRDLFRFEVQAGQVVLNISGVTEISNLNVSATLYNSWGHLVTRLEDVGLSARINTQLPSGTYFLEVDGEGHGQAQDDGYSDYGSLGYYRISGSFSATQGAIVPTPPALASVVARARRGAIDHYWATQEREPVVPQVWSSLRIEPFALIESARLAARER